MKDNLLNIEEQLKFIRNFEPMNQISFDAYNKDTNALNAQLWSLYQRMCEARKSFLLLLDNKYHYEAFLVVGQMLETCATVSYIKDNPPEKQITNLCKYLAKSAIEQLIILLESDVSNLNDDNIKLDYIEKFLLFAKLGESIVDLDKDEKKTTNKKDRHNHIIEQLTKNYKKTLKK